jgi:outer membrane protein assembly factor BamB
MNMQWAIVLLSLCVAQAGQQAPPYTLNREAKRVTRQDAKKKVLWTRTFDDDVGGVRPPHLLWDENRVYFTHGYGVTALDAKDGKTVWHAKGPVYGLLLRDGLLLGTGYTKNDDGNTHSCWLFACNAAEGKLSFKTLLPKEFSDPQAVREVADLFLVQIGEAPGGKGSGLLFDKKGDIRHRLDRQLVTAKRLGDDLIFLTSKDVLRVSATDKSVWSVPFEHHEWIAGGGFVDVPGGDVVAFRYCHIADSGVDVIRLNPASGKEIWKVHCSGLRVRHSEYSHEAFVRVDGENLQVTSEGSSGTFIETLNLKTGRQIDRTRKDRKD